MFLDKFHHRLTFGDGSDKREIRNFVEMWVRRIENDKIIR